MTGAELLAAIVSVVEAAPVESVTARDVLRHQPVASSDTPMDERMFSIIPTTYPQRPELSGMGTCSKRTIELALAVAYAWSPRASARVIDDGALIANALEGAPGVAQDIDQVVILGTHIDYSDAAIVASTVFTVTYTAS